MPRGDYMLAPGRRPNTSVPAAGGSAFAKYRSFNGSTGLIDWSMGNLAGASSDPQTLVTVVRLVSEGGSDGEIIACPGFDPLDLFWIRGTSTIAFSDGPGFVNGPSWVTGTDWCLFAFRTLVGASTKWSKSLYSGSAWPTPTHTSGGVTLSARTYPTSGTVTMGNTTAVVFDMVCFAIFNTDLTDAQINAMTAGVSAIRATSNITTLWVAGQTSPADIVGTAEVATITGTTLSTADSPFLL